MAEESALLAACLGVLAILVCLAATSFTSLAPTEMGLQYNGIMKTISPIVVDTPGFKVIGPFSSLITYPKTIQTLNYDGEHRDLLDGRTHDGLPLVLGVAFQYRLFPDKLFELYHMFENSVGDYEHVFRLVGSHIITEEATKFTAYEFFNNKQAIAGVMRMKLDQYFQKYLFASVESLQINEDDLPEAFTETILMAATCKQNITRMEKTRDAMVVKFQTARNNAEAQANVTIQKAIGDTHRIMQNGKADSEIINAYVEAQLQAYGRVHDDLGLKGADLLKYIWYDTLSGGGVATDASQVQNMQMLFGVNPAAYINER